jgi:hypothetical protein
MTRRPSQQAASNMTADIEKPSRAAKLRHELTRYAIVSLYLYVCFGALILFKWGVLRAHDVDYAPWGIAAVKALIVGKFILIGQAMRLGKTHRGQPLIANIAYRVLLFAAFILVLTFIEELVKAALHGEPMSAALSDIARGGWLQIVAACLLLCLILTPYFGLGAIDDALGEDRLRRMFFGPKSA